MFTALSIIDHCPVYSLEKEVSQTLSCFPQPQKPMLKGLKTRDYFHDYGKMEVPNTLRSLLAKSKIHDPTTWKNMAGANHL